MNFNEIKIRIEASQSADFGTVFNDSINLFKKTWLQGFLMICYYMLFVLCFVFLIILPIALCASLAQFTDISTYAGMSFLAILGIILLVLVLITVLITIVNGLLGGLYLIYKKADNDQFFSTSDFFVLLRKDKIFKTFKVGISQIGITFVAMILCYFPIFYVMIPLRFLIVIYAYNQELTTTEIVKLAFQIGNKNWFVTFGLLLVTGIVSYIGILLCGVGMLFTFAIILIPTYFIYKHAIGFEDESEIDAIGIEEGF